MASGAVKFQQPAISTLTRSKGIRPLCFMEGNQPSSGKAYGRLPLLGQTEPPQGLASATNIGRAGPNNSTSPVWHVAPPAPDPPVGNVKGGWLNGPHSASCALRLVK